MPEKPSEDMPEGEARDTIPAPPPPPASFRGGDALSTDDPDALDILSRALEGTPS